MRKVTLVLSLVLLTATVSAVAQDESAKRKKGYNLEDGVAIQGFDPVAYFTASRAEQGKKDFSFQYQGVTYRFANAKNEKLFRDNPEKYEPQYGGWCAYAMGAAGEKVEVDPETFKIVDGKLYLFYNAYFNNTLKKWNADEVNLKKKADTNWTKIYR